MKGRNMLSKRAIIVALTGLNLLLLAVLILFNYSPPTAYAQRGGGRPGDYLMATAQIHSDYDALAIINIPAGVMHVFVPREVPGGAKLAWTATRNLNRDFGRLGPR